MDILTNWMLLVAIVTVLSTLYKYLTRNYGYWETQGIPFEKGYPIVGSELALLINKEMHEVDLMRFKKHGKIYGTYFTGDIIFNVSDPEIIKLILVKDFHYFVNRLGARTGHKALDKSLTLALDEDWRRIRSVISPAFSSGKIRQMGVFLKNGAKNVTEELLTLAEKKQPTDIKTKFSNYTIEVMGSCTFGVHVDPYKNPDHPFVVRTKAVFQSGRFLAYFLVLLSGQIFKMLPKWLSILVDKSPFAYGLRFFQKVAEELIEQRRGSNEKYVDFLQLMIDAKESEKPDQTNVIRKDEEKREITDTENVDRKQKWTKTLDEDEIVAQCTTFLFAGHDTVATSLTYVAYDLACHPEIQENLLQEVDETWEKYGDIDHNVVSNMKYLNAVISESLRLHTVSVRIQREVKEDYRIPNTDIVLPKNSIVIIPSHVLHHDPDFFSEPEKFDPERFLPENISSIKPYSYLPFAEGPRNCVARRFAQMQIKMCLAYVLRYVRFSPTEELKNNLKLYVGFGVLQPRKTMIQPEKRRSSKIL